MFFNININKSIKMCVLQLDVVYVIAAVFLHWQEQQQMEHEEDMRARLRRSESIEKAAVSPS